LLAAHFRFWFKQVYFNVREEKGLSGTGTTLIFYDLLFIIYKVIFL
jgi:hypothetical protein